MAVALALNIHKTHTLSRVGLAFSGSAERCFCVMASPRVFARALVLLPAWFFLPCFRALTAFTLLANSGVSTNYDLIVLTKRVLA